MMKMLLSLSLSFKKKCVSLWQVIFATQSPQELIPENINAKVELKLKQVFALTQAKFLLNMEESDVSVVEKL